MLRAWLADQSSGCRQLCTLARRPCGRHQPLLSAVFGQHCRHCHRRTVACGANQGRGTALCRQACTGRRHEHGHPGMHGLMAWANSRRGCCMAAGSGSEWATLSKEDFASWGYGEDGATAEAGSLAEPWSDAEDNPELVLIADAAGAAPPPEMDIVQVLDPPWHLAASHADILSCLHAGSPVLLPLPPAMQHALVNSLHSAQGHARAGACGHMHAEHVAHARVRCQTCWPAGAQTSAWQR